MIDLTAYIPQRDSAAVRPWLLAAIAVGVLLRLRNLLHEPGLWADEAFSVAVSQSPLLDVVLATLRFDTHPPLYYLQLHFWGLAGQSDLWLLANSLTLNLLSIAVLYIACRAHYGAGVAILAAAVMALMPQQLFFADNLRMYSFCAVLSILLWDRLERRLKASESAGTASLIGIAALGIALTLSHGLGFFVTFFIFLQALVRQALAAWRSGTPLLSSEPARLALVYASVAVFAAYSLVIGSFRATVGLDAVTLEGIGVHLAIALLGNDFPAPAVAGLVAAIVLFVPPMLVATSRGVMGWLVILPLATLLTLSLTVTPVFIFRTIGLFHPFLAIALALAADALIRRGSIMRGVVAATALLLAGAAVNHSISYTKAGYNNLAAAWEAHAAPGAAFVAENPSDYWGFTRYLDGVSRDSALTIQPPVRSGMRALKERLDGTILERLGFFGQSDRADVDGRTYLIHPPEEPWITAREIWLLAPQNGRGCADYGLTLAETLTDNDLVMNICR